MGSDALEGMQEFFKQCVAKQHQVCVHPLRSVGDKQTMPVFFNQCLPQQVWCAPQCRVFIEQRDRVAHMATLRTHALSRDFLRLQAVELCLGLRKPQPTQAIEKIMRQSTRGNFSCFKHMVFISHAFRQDMLRHKLNGLFGRFFLVEGIRQRTACTPMAQHWLPPALPRQVTRSLPIHLWQKARMLEGVNVGWHARPGFHRRTRV